MLQMKLTSNGRWPQNIESGISQQPLGRSYPNVKLMLGGPNQTLQILQMNMTIVGSYKYSKHN